MIQILLIPRNAINPVSEMNKRNQTIGNIKIGDITTNPFQPAFRFWSGNFKWALADSIGKVQGLIQPITVEKLKEGNYQFNFTVRGV